MPRYATRRDKYSQKASMSARSWARNRGIYGSGGLVPRKSRLRIQQAGVGGASTKMSSTSIAPPPEVKFKDYNVLTAPGTGDWTIISSNTIYGILQGTGPSERVGRKIKVVGIVIRISVNTDIAGGLFSPYTMDVLWDNQCNGALPAIADIYVGAGGINLPNPLVDERFQFIHRVKQNNPNTATTIIDRTLKTSKIIDYKTTINAITDLTGSNLILTFTSPSDATPALSGIVRILYTDA